MGRHPGYVTKDGKTTYAAYNLGTQPLKTSFSDRTKLTAKPGELTVSEK